MKNLNRNDVLQYVEDNIGVFHEKRILSLNNLRLPKILRRKNPYLYRAKNVLTADEIVRSIVDAHLSSSEEGIFGDWLEGLAIFINQKVYNGWKSGIPGIDLEFDFNNRRYIVTIKSGPNWGNSQQIKRLKDVFRTAKRTLRTSNSQLNVVAVNGCCYGKDRRPDKGDYFKYCGQEFWQFISGEESLFLQIIEPLGYKAKERNEVFMNSYAQMLNKFTKEFTTDYCKDSGEIDWAKLVNFNSAKQSLQLILQLMQASQ